MILTLQRHQLRLLLRLITNKPKRKCTTLLKGMLLKLEFEVTIHDYPLTARQIEKRLHIAIDWRLTFEHSLS
jgi:hypothetical protein